MQHSVGGNKGESSCVHWCAICTVSCCRALSAHCILCVLQQHVVASFLMHMTTINNNDSDGGNDDGGGGGAMAAVTTTMMK